jgi:hypothetical protein
MVDSDPRPLVCVGEMKLRRVVWDDGLPSVGGEDYEVIDDRGEKVGRLFRLAPWLSVVSGGNVGGSGSEATD